MFGKNAGKQSLSKTVSETELKKLYQEYKKNACIAEQIIIQHPELEKFNLDSVNTIRVVTLMCADGMPKVMAAVLRLGRKGKTADNFHHYGIAATVEPEKGIVNAPGIDRDFKRYIVHPDSGRQIIGFQIPSWDMVVSLVNKAATVIPEVRYVGWDVAIDCNGVPQLIEGNYGADPDVTQMPCREGIWPAYRKEIDMIRRLRK